MIDGMFEHIPGFDPGRGLCADETREKPVVGREVRNPGDELECMPGLDQCLWRVLAGQDLCRTVLRRGNVLGLDEMAEETDDSPGLYGAFDVTVDAWACTVEPVWKKDSVSADRGFRADFMTIDSLEGPGTVCCYNLTATREDMCRDGALCFVGDYNYIVVHPAIASIAAESLADHIGILVYGQINPETGTWSCVGTRLNPEAGGMGVVRKPRKVWAVLQPDYVRRQMMRSMTRDIYNLAKVQGRETIRRCHLLL